MSKNEKYDQLNEWIQDFQAANRRSLEERWNNGMIHTYKPVLDDKPYRAFDSLEEYRKWCQHYLPSWLGYGQTL